MMNSKVTWIPPMDLYELDNDYILKAEIPGVARRDVEIEFSGLEFTVRGERKFDSAVDKENCQGEGGRRRKFQRTFSLPEPVDRNRMQITLKDGVLCIVLPKAGGAKNRSRGAR